LQPRDSSKGERKPKVFNVRKKGKFLHSCKRKELIRIRQGWRNTAEEGKK